MNNEIITLRERIVLKDEIIRDLHEQYGRDMERLKARITQLEKELDLKTPT